LALAGSLALSSGAAAQSADEVRKIWNDPAQLDRQKQEDQQRARVAADQAAQQAAQQRAAVETAQRAVLGLPEEERKRIQGSLALLGFYQGPNDGNLASPETSKAITEWQKSGGRPQTGKLTPPEAEALNKEAATRSGPKERLDSEAGIAARRAEAAQTAPPDVVQKLFDGAREDLIVLVNETGTAPHVQKAQSGPPSFKDRQAQICAQFGWQPLADFGTFVRSELGRLGADKLTPELARACADQHQTMDLVLLERRHLFEQSQDKVRPLLSELRDRKLTVLATIPFADLPAWRDRQAQEAARKAEEEEKRKQDAARKVDEEKRAKEAANDPVQRRKVAEPRTQVMLKGLLDRLRAHVDKGAPLEEGLDGFKRWYEQRKSEGRQVADMRATVDDFGEARLQGRTIEAISVEVDFDLKAANGPPQTDCLVFAWLEEPPIWRAPAVFGCDRVGDLERWKADNGFRSRWR
jgi:hypothetical protein